MIDLTTYCRLIIIHQAARSAKAYTLYLGVMKMEYKRHKIDIMLNRDDEFAVRRD